MASKSKITQQYAKQKGGAMFDFLNPSEPAKTGPAPETLSDPAPAPAPAAEPVSTENKGIFDKFKETIGLDKPTEGETPAPAPAPAPAPEPEPNDKEESITNKIANFFTGDKKEPETGAEGEAGQESTDSEASEASEASEEIDESEDSESEDSENAEGDEFEMIVQKMTTLREKYSNLKKEHADLKLEMEREKKEKVDKDVSDLTTVFAATEAAELALSELKTYLIKYSKNNGLPIEKLGYSDSTPTEEPSKEEPSAPAPEQAPEPAPAPAPEPAPEPAPAPAPAPAPDMMAAPEPPAPDMMAAPEPPAPDAESISGSDSESASESESESNDKETSTLPEIPVNEITTASAMPAMPVPPAPPASFNGGRNHYIQSTNKKAKTHRHHKRRNRHQTLRSLPK